MVFADYLFGILDHHHVVEDQEVGIEDLGVVLTHLSGEVAADDVEIGACRIERALEAIDLGVDINLIDTRVGHADGLRAHHERGPDDDTGGRR